MIFSRRGLLAGLAAVLLAAGCTTAVQGTARPVPQPVPPTTAHRTVAPERIQFRLVVTDGTGGLTMTDRDGKQYVVGEVELDGTKVLSAHADFQAEYRSWVVTVRLTSAGAAAFGQLTSAHVNQQLAIVVDDVVVSAPTIQSAITDGVVQISGTFTQDEATGLADSINGR
ncbi:SecDF P1 head subdomain-containing protein [Labedaea rhizosphaerae]|uniref:SecDF P1 head subdomain domain-containing protein n=1 Tax=Labedaea rhizosphaerae TaxID=598644 RepID=A0A4R6S069_LABRH|nr:hypothetical protein [Labedaea rhizosphaerae]TDP91965.1 hypothetical protein EV186_108178 [Labedaea rhizosphaerae]